MSDEICWLSAIELASRIQAKEISPVESVEAALKQLDRLNQRLNAVVTRTDELARSQAKEAESAVLRGDALGPLHGVPLVVKDLHFTAGVRTTCGSELYADFVPEFDHPIVQRLREAGCILLGKTNTSEFGLIPLASSRLLGDACNPWNLQHNTGGSSGGSASAVVSGIAPLATASDGGGSIRVPASFCGAFGIKPQHGRVPHIHQPQGWESLAHQGPITRHVRDAARMLDVTSGPHPLDRWSLPKPQASFEQACDQGVQGLRLAWSPGLGANPVEPGILEACQASVDRFAELGCEVEQLDLDLPDMTSAQQTIVLCETLAAMGARLDEWKEVITPSMSRLPEKAAGFTISDLMEAHWARERYWEKISPVFEEFDALLTPVCGITAPENGTLGPREIAGHKIRALGWLSFCVPFNMTWQPAASLPVGFDDTQMPVGLQVVGRRHDEATVFRLSAAYEDAFGPLCQRPPVSSADRLDG